MDESQKRAQVRAIQNDSSLTNTEKLQRIQVIMGRTEVKPVESKYNFPPKEEISTTKPGNDILGCKHYVRKCKIQAKCCGSWVVCRLCHDEAINDHEIDRRATTTMICMLCKTVQPIGQTCTNCSEEMGKYFCSICNLLDSSPNKNIYHCDKCTICRIGIAEDYIHCDTCNICLHASIAQDHECLNDTFNQNCPICCEYLHTSVQPVKILRCGHPIHDICLNSYASETSSPEDFRLLRCPSCQKAVSTTQLEAYSEVLDDVISAHPLPPELQKTVHILCNECNQVADVPFHVYGNKCPTCGTYNTTLHGTSIKSH